MLEDHVQFAILCMYCLSISAKDPFHFSDLFSVYHWATCVWHHYHHPHVVCYCVNDACDSIPSQQCHAVAGKISGIVRKCYVTREDVGAELHKGLCVGIEKALMFLWAKTGLEQE